MRKLILLLIISPVLFIQCEDDDKSGALVGVWIGQSITVTDCSDPTANSFESIPCTETNCYRLELLSDRTYNFQQGSRLSSGDWIPSLSLCITDEGETVCDEYAVIENTSSTLVISSTNEATACATIIAFQRELVEETEDDGTS